MDPPSHAKQALAKLSRCSASPLSSTEHQPPHHAPAATVAVARRDFSPSVYHVVIHTLALPFFFAFSMHRAPYLSSSSV
jgi:hypothetical protein